MPLTQTQLRDRIATDLMKKYFAALTATQVKDALLAASAPDKSLLLDNLRRGNEQKVGSIIYGITNAYLLGLAKSEADTIVSDNSLNAAELNRWLGDG